MLRKTALWVFLLLAAAPVVCQAVEVTPRQLNFSGPPGTTLPAQNVRVEYIDYMGSIPRPFTSSVSSNATWLRRSPESGTTPATVAVSAVTTGLAAGTYTGQISFISGTESGTLTVTLVVSGTGVATNFRVSPSAVNVTGGANGPAALDLQIEDTGSAAGAVETFGGNNREIANWTASVQFLNGSNWLAVSPTSGSAQSGAPNALRLAFNYSGLAAGNIYQALVLVRNTGTNRTTTVPVTVTMPAARAQLALSQNALFYSNASNLPGGAPPQTVQIINVGSQSTTWTITGLPDWVQPSATTGTSPANAAQAPVLNLAVNSTGRGSGVYQTLATITSAAGEVQLLPITLLVVPSATPPSPLITPNSLIFVATQGGTPPPTQTVSISNTGGGLVAGQFSASTTSGGNWLSVSPGGGDTANGPFNITVRANLLGVPLGTFRGKITMNVIGGTPQEIEVTLIHAPAAGFTAAGASGAGDGRALAACTPTGLEVAGTTIGSGLTLPVSFPKVITALAVDSCGNAVTNAALSTSVDGTTVAMQSLGNGFYSGTWVPARALSNVQLTINATHSTFGTQRKTFSISTSTAAGGIELPVLPDGGVVEGAAFSPARPLVPGQIVSIFGQRLASDTLVAGSTPLPRALLNTRVRIGGFEAPLYFVSAGQVNAQVPYEITPGATVPIVLNVNGRLTTPSMYSIAAGQPAIFKAGTAGDAAVLDSQSRLVNAQNPAVIGDTLQVFVNGLGLTDVNVETGSPWPALSNLRNPVSVTIGGQAASVAFQGLAPGFVGLYQVNVVVPSTVTPGSAVPIVITQNGVPSNAESPLTIPVRAR